MGDGGGCLAGEAGLPYQGYVVEDMGVRSKLSSNNQISG
jgi:hypothetical protein